MPYRFQIQNCFPISLKKDRYQMISFKKRNTINRHIKAVWFLSWVAQSTKTNREKRTKVYLFYECLKQCVRNIESRPADYRCKHSTLCFSNWTIPCIASEVFGYRFLIAFFGICLRLSLVHWHEVIFFRSNLLFVSSHIRHILSPIPSELKGTRINADVSNALL